MNIYSLADWGMVKNINKKSCIEKKTHLDCRAFYHVYLKALALLGLDIDTVISRILSDDCKQYVPTTEDIDILQQNINTLCQLSILKIGK